ncbi:flagellar basal-body rod protein FlgF [Acidimangrovimonas pyrenivorans]|uniref:Flagellar basal-body rod protein FlgF n=1 Tax=Acidimangrovimonas pyrenivorans TaxID=2030798 RepID=A0ABV7AMK3_9RHOB
MDNSTYVSLSRAAALRRSLDVTANNMANANTVGFKAQRADFRTMVESQQTGADGTSYVLNRGSYLDGSQGQLTRTDNPLDVAISGNGWFAYATPTGQTAYGRDGRFSINQRGDLVTLTGAQVLDEGGAPIAIPADTGTQLQIASDGTITGPQGATIAKIGLFDVPGIADFKRIGAGMFVAPDGSNARSPAADSKISQGFVEESNVQPVIEMTRMMEIQRAYEQAMKIMDDENQLRQQTLSKLGNTA